MSRKSRFTADVAMRVLRSGHRIEFNPLKYTMRQKYRVMESLARRKLVFRRRLKLNWVAYWLPKGDH